MTIDIIDLGLKIAIVIAIYILYQKQSLKIRSQQAQISERIGRWNIVTGLEANINLIHAQKWALKKTKSTGENGERIEKFELRNVLNNKPDWLYVEYEGSQPNSGFKCPIFFEHDGCKYWQIRSYTNENNEMITEYVSSIALHESLIWFRKVDRAIKAKLLKPNEVADWWRQILPFGWSGRLEYLRKYFQGLQDIESIVRVISEVLFELDKQNHENAIDYCRYFNGSDRDVLKSRGDSGKKAVRILPIHRSN